VAHPVAVPLPKQPGHWATTYSMTLSPFSIPWQTPPTVGQNNKQLVNMEYDVKSPAPCEQRYITCGLLGI